MTLEIKTCKNPDCKIEFSWPSGPANGLCWECNEAAKRAHKAAAPADDHKARASGEEPPY